jgi:hypothetical protein
MHTTYNSPHCNCCPDPGITPLRSERNTNWEGGLVGTGLHILAEQDQGRLSAQRNRHSPRLVRDIPGDCRRT